MKPLRYIFLLFTLLWFVTACGSNNASQTPKTTVLVYIEGTNLESNGALATANIKEMLAAASAPHLNVILTTGAADKAKAEDPVKSWRTVKRHQIKDGKIIELADLGTVDMGNPQVLTDFITWSQTSFPADKYILVFWDHGGGPIYGYGGDQATGTSSLSIARLAGAVQDAVKITGKRFELLGFDACLMATVEVAAYLEPVSRYLIASEELEPGPGWDYTPFLNAIANNPAADGLAAGTAIVDGYAAKTRKETEEFTLSVIDLSKIGVVITALRQFSEYAIRSFEDNVFGAWIQLAEARNHADEYGADFINERFTNLIDLGHFAALAAQADPRWQASNASISEALKQAVRYNTVGAMHGSSTGLSVYFPFHNLEAAQQTLLEYAKTPFDLQYFSLMSRFITYPLTNKPGNLFHVGEPEMGGTTIETLVTSPLGLAEQYVAIIGSTPASDNSYLLLGMDLPVVHKLMDTLYRLSYTRTDTWFTLGANQVTVYFETAIPDGRYVVVIPTLYRPAGSTVSDRRPVNITLLYNPATNSGSIAQAWEGIQPDGMANRVAVHMKVNDLITPVFQKITPTADGEDLIEYVSGTEFAINQSALTFSRTAIQPGSYSLAFLAQDLGGNTEVSSLVDFNVTASKSAQKQPTPSFKQQGFWGSWKK